MAYQLATAFVRIMAVGAKGLLGVFNSLKNYAISTFKAISGLLFKIGVIAGGISFAGIIKLASDAQELDSMFEAVFGKNTERANEFAENLGLKIGRSVGDIKSQMANFQDTFVPLGFARDEASDLSMKLTELVQDVGSFKNMDPRRVAEAFQSGLVGAHRALRQFGIVITQANLDQELLAMGVAKGVKGATELQKVQARLNLIFKGTTDAQGDAAFTAGSFENRIKGLKGAIKDISGDIGAAFLPALANIAKMLTDLIRKAQPIAQKWAKYFADAGNAMTQNWGTMWKYIQKIASIGTSIIGDLFMQIPEMFGYAVGAATRVVWEGFKLLFNGLKAIVMGFMKWQEAQWDQTFENWMAAIQGRKARDVKGDSDNIFEMFETFSDKLNKTGGAIAKGFRMENPLSAIELSERTKKRMEELKEMVDEGISLLPEDPERPKKSDGNNMDVDTITVKDFSLPTGFMDFKDASVKIQETLLKNADPQRQTVVELKHGNRLAQELLLTMRKVENNTAKISGGGGGTAVATE